MAGSLNKQKRLRQAQPDKGVEASQIAIWISVHRHN